MTTPIEDYAVLGDMETCALVSLEGSIDWMCLPRFDSPACFAALLGHPENGRWLLTPVEQARTTRRYVGNSFVLETRHETEGGVVTVTDFMPDGDGRADLVRIVKGVSGTVRMRHEWLVRFGYGKVRPWVRRRKDADDERVLTAIAGPEMLVLRSGRLPKAVDGRHQDEFEVSRGEKQLFSTTWFNSWHDIPTALDFEERLAVTSVRSERWLAHYDHTGPYAEAVRRSLLVLRLLTHADTGGIVAAPTTSLPEDFGGTRNWDYRYCWLRDASLTLESLLDCGFSTEGELWRGWLLRAVAGDPQDIQIMYGVDGSREIPERELDHLDGYAGSAPVRVGNGAVDQRQTDVLGEVMNALHIARESGVKENQASWALQKALVGELAEHWEQPDNGLWEIRGPLRHFTHSRVMVWVAFDRAISAIEDYGMDGPLEQWREIRDKVREEVLERGFNTERGTFTQHYDTTEVDASLLVIPLVGFLPADDERVKGTIAAVEQDLMSDGLLLRYRTEAGVDGLPGKEHPFLACSFWLVSAYALSGRLEDAHALMGKLVGLSNDLGLMAEEYDPQESRMVGNFPQAFSHLTLVGAALSLRKAEHGKTALTE